MYFETLNLHTKQNRLSLIVGLLLVVLGRKEDTISILAQY